MLPRFASLLFCLILAGCRSHSAINPALAALVPPDTVALAGVRMDQLRATPLYRKLAEQNRLPRLDQFRAEDVTEVVLAHDGKHGLLLARGEFTSKSAPPPVTLLNPHIALAGPAAMVRAAIDQSKGSPRRAPAALLARLPTDGQIWAVAIGWPGLPPAALQQLGNAANLDRLLRSVADMRLTASFASGLHAAATADCRTGQDAATLAENLRGLASLARLGVPKNDPQLSRAFDALQIRQDGRAITLTIDLSEDLAEQLAGLWR